MRTSQAVELEGRRFSGMTPRATILIAYSSTTHVPVDSWFQSMGSSCHDAGGRPDSELGRRRTPRVDALACR